MASSTRLDELLKKFDENPRRYFAPLANEHRKLGDLEQAISICRSHLPQQPGHVSGHIVLAQALYEAREMDEARQTFETALDLDPENLIALRHLGDIASELGERGTARTWYERVLDADPRNEEIGQLLRDLDTIPESDTVSAHGESASTQEYTGNGYSVATASAYESTLPTPRVVSAIPDTPAPPSLSFAGAEAIESPSFGPSAIPGELISDAPTPPRGSKAYVPFTPASSTSDPFEDAPADTSADVQEAQPEVAEESFDAYAGLSTGVDYGDLEAVADPEPEEWFASPSPEPEKLTGSGSEEFSAMDIAGLAEMTREESPTHDQAASWTSPPPNVSLDGLDLSDDLADARPNAGLFVPLDAAAALEAPEVSVSEAFSHAGAAGGMLEHELVIDTERPTAPVTQESDPDATAGFDAFALSFDTDDDSAVADSERHTAEGAPNEQSLDEPFDIVGVDEERAEAPLTEQSEIVTSERDSSHSAVPTAVADKTDDDGFGFEAHEFVPPEEASIAAAEGLESMDGIFPGAEQIAPIVGYEPIEPERAEPVAKSESDFRDIVVTPAPMLGHTPALGSRVVEAMQPIFATETLAELYLQQGFRSEALAVYRQLLERNPNDNALHKRIAHLERGAESSIEEEPAVDKPLSRPRSDMAGQSVRAFFGTLAQRRPRRRETRHAEAAPPLLNGNGERASYQPPSGTSLDEMFGGRSAGIADDAAAASLASAFSVTGDDRAAVPTLTGRPARAAETELSLDQLFRGRDRLTPAAGNVTLDQFYAAPAESPGSGEAPDDGGGGGAPDERHGDIQQFTAWLEGLKKK